MEKVKYEVDPHNRLIVESGGHDSSLSYFRHIMNGEFVIGKKNVLIYNIKAPSRPLARRLNLPCQLKLRGKWSLTENHDLRLTLDKCQLEGFRNEVVLKGELIAAKADSLLFALTQRMGDNETSTRVLTMEGVWQADRNNRLAFRADKESGKYDILTLQGAWEIGANHQIVYKYKKSFSECGKDAERFLAFNGFWNISEKDILTYHLDFINRSLFNFRVGRGCALEDRITYEVGIGLKNRRRPMRSSIVLYGKWNIVKRIGLVFEISYGSDRAGGIVFAAEARLAPDSKIELDLKTESGKPLGMSLTLSKIILSGAGEIYSKALFSEKEKAVYVGAGFTW